MIASFVCSCDSTLECYNLFSGVQLSIRSFCFIWTSDLSRFQVRLLTSSQELHNSSSPKRDNHQSASKSENICHTWNFSSCQLPNHLCHVSVVCKSRPPPAQNTSALHHVLSLMSDQAPFLNLSVGLFSTPTCLIISSRSMESSVRLLYQMPSQLVYLFLPILTSQCGVQLLLITMTKQLVTFLNLDGLLTAPPHHPHLLVTVTILLQSTTRKSSNDTCSTHKIDQQETDR